MRKNSVLYFQQKRILFTKKGLYVPDKVKNFQCKLEHYDNKIVCCRFFKTESYNNTVILFILKWKQ